jgi:uncharacterized protein (DUF362 family)
MNKSNPALNKENLPAQRDIKTITRRDFLKISGVVALAAGASSCSLNKASESQMPTNTHTPITDVQAPNPSLPSPPVPSITPSPLPIQQNTKAQVAFIKTTDRAQGVRRGLDLLGINPFSGKSVLLKPNFNSADSGPGSTHNDILRSIVEYLWEAGAQSITVADRSGMGDTRQVMKQKGILDMAAELGFEILVLDELEKDDWVLLESPDSHWERGFLFPRPFLEADRIIQTCCLKTHRYGGHFTISLKNSVGMVAKFGPDGYNYMSELHNSPNQRKMIAEINTAYHPTLVVVDAIEAFVRGGPASGKRVSPEVVLVGTDRIALDAVGVAILRSFGTTAEVERGRIFEQEQIARAAALGLGISRPEDIELLTDDSSSTAYAEQIQEILLSQ